MSGASILFVLLKAFSFIPRSFWEFLFVSDVIKYLESISSHVSFILCPLDLGRPSNLISSPDVLALIQGNFLLLAFTLTVFFEAKLKLIKK